MYMRTILLLAFAALTALSAQGQVVSTFDTLNLSKSDTFYVNYSSSGNDVGYNDGLAQFPCYYDTSFGGFWSNGFAYSNMNDTLTSGYVNQYAAITGEGSNSSSNYAVFYQGYGTNNKIKFLGAQYYKPQGYYITNSTYAFNSMRDGDGFAKKFGGTTGNDPDWFKLTIYGYVNGTVSDSVEFYLADFRDANNANDYIIKDWQWVNLQPLNFADSIDFLLTSSDMGSFGMNTPAYFCMDDLTILGLNLSVNETQNNFDFKVYPNPVAEKLFVESKYGTAQKAIISDLNGRILFQQNLEGQIIISAENLPAGMYLLQLNNGTQQATTRFIKQ